MRSFPADPRPDRPARRRVAAAILGAAALTLAACSGATDPVDDADPTQSSASPSATDGEAVRIPESPVGSQTLWVLGVLDGEGPTAQEAHERFSAEFLAQVPAEQMGAVFDQLRAMGPFTLESYEENGDTARAMVLGSGDARYAVDVALDDQGLMSRLLITPAAPVPTVTDPAEASDELVGAAEVSSLLFATVAGEGDQARCEPVEERETEVLRPIGSMFKLYVLGAVVRGVEDGTLTWDQELTLTDEARSLPSGTLQDEPAGTTITARDAAAQMNAISDNTATDLLIDAVGRENVEDTLAEMGASAPSANIPFLTTREMFQIGFSDPDLPARWAEVSGLTGEVGDIEAPADPAVDDAQRALLAELPAWDLTLDPAAGATAFWPNGADWFATAHDLCAAHVHLQRLAGTEAGEPVRDILSANPGVELPEAEYVAFKGGSSIGEIGGSWYVERPDGAREVLVMLTGGGDAAAVPDAGWLMGVAQQALGGDHPN